MSCININGGSSSRERALPSSLPPPSFLRSPPTPTLPRPRWARSRRGRRTVRLLRRVRPGSRLGNRLGSLQRRLVLLGNRQLLRSLAKRYVTLHLGGIEASQALIAFLGFLILIDPLGPIHLDVLVLLLGLEQPGPEWRILVLLLEDEEQMEAGLVPLGGLLIDLLEELKGEGVLLPVTVANKGQGGIGEFYVIIGDVSELHLEIDLVLSLSPLGDWMSR